MKSYVLVLTSNEVEYLKKVIRADVLHYTALFGANKISYEFFDSYLDIPTIISNKIAEVSKDEN